MLKTIRGVLVFHVFIASDDQEGEILGRFEGAVTARRKSCCGKNAGNGGDQRSYGFDSLAGKQGRAGGGSAEANGAAVDAPEHLAWSERDRPLGGALGIEPGALHALDEAIIAGDGGDQRREAVDAVITSMDEIGMKP